MNVKQSILKKPSLKTNTLEVSSNIQPNNAKKSKKLNQRASSVKNVRFFGVEDGFRPENSDYTDYYPIPLSASSSTSYKSNGSEKIRNFFNTSNPISLRQINVYRQDKKKLPTATNVVQICSTDKVSDTQPALKIIGIGDTIKHGNELPVSDLKPEETNETVTYKPLVDESIKNANFQSSNYYYLSNKSNNLRVNSSYPTLSSPSKQTIKQEKLQKTDSTPIREYKRPISSFSTYFSTQKAISSLSQNESNSSFNECNGLIEKSSVNLQTSSPSIALYTYLLDLNKRMNRGIKASEIRSQTKCLHSTEKSDGILVKPVVFPIIKKSSNISQTSTNEDRKEFSETTAMLNANAVQKSLDATACRNALK
jgi:hypothetical protein